MCPDMSLLNGIMSLFGYRTYAVEYRMHCLVGYWLARQKIPIIRLAHESTTNFTVRQRSINIDTVERSQQNRLYMPMYSLLRRLSSQPCHSQKIFY